jgi:hypothetical protein
MARLFWAVILLNYNKSPLVPALWKHKTRPTQFILIVNDFGIKYFTKNDPTIYPTLSRNITT